MTNYNAEIITTWQGSGTDESPNRPYVPEVLSWVDATGQPVASIPFVNAYTLQVKATTEQLAALVADPLITVIWSQEIPEDDSEPESVPNLTQPQIDALVTELETFYYADVPKLAASDTQNPVEIADNLKQAQLYPPWQPGLNVDIGEVYLYGEGVENLFEVVQAHTTQADWKPNIVSALFKRYYEPDDNPWPWTQPQGAHDAYPVGARVLHDGYTWENTTPANVWEPGIFGWINLTPPPPTDEWAVGVAYAIDDEVTYLGNTYRCLQAHTSQAGWNPVAVPALWEAA